MASTTFIKINNGYGIKKSNQEYFINRNTAESNYSVLSTPTAVLRPFRRNQLCTQICSNMTWTYMSKSKQALLRPRISLKCRAELMELNHAPFKEEIEIPRSTLLWRAAKIPMYAVALLPVTVGSALAYWQSGHFSIGRYFALLASFVIVNVWIKLSNDVYDFDTGADKDKKESVVNLFGSRNLINFIAWSLLVIGFGGFAAVAMMAKSSTSIIFLAFAVFCFFLYQCPPYRLSYYGIGEPILFTGFGPLATIPFYLLQSRASVLPISGTVIWSSLLVGCTTALILFCSHFHQIKGDKAAGKISPLVRLGTEKGSRVVKAGVVGLYSLVLSLGISKTLPLASVILCAMTLPVANYAVDFVDKNHKDNAKIFMSKYYFVRLHTIFGFALSAGLVLARLLAKQSISQAIVV